MKRHYFISDIHLGRKREGSAYKRLISFLNFIKRDAESLFILGDLFDFWWEYKTVIPKEDLDFLLLIRDLRREGIKVYYIPGNHDHFTGRFFAGLGLTVEKEVTIFLQGKPVFLMHGEDLDNSFLTLLSRFAYRSFLSRFLFSLLHPNLGIPLAKAVIGLAGGPVWKANLMERFRRFAAKKIADGFFLVCLGHIHEPVLERIGEGYYLNPGDWLKNFTYGIIEGEEVRLARWGEDSAEEIKDLGK